MRHALLTLMLVAMPAMAGTHHPRHHRSASAPAGVHVVRKGETAGKIAAANGLSLPELQRLNPGRDLARLSLGTKLRLAAMPARIAIRQPEGEPTSGEGSATLAKGQTLFGLAKAHGLSVQDLLDANPGLNPRRIRAGTALRLPQGASGDGTSAVATAAPPPSAGTQDASPDGLGTRVIRVKNRRKKRIRYHGRHKGIDLPAPMHTDIYAALDGVIVYAGKARGYGNLVTIDHGNGVSTVYGHESVTLVHEGDIVHRGDKIAEVGRAGNATGPHLHFELRINGVQQNPLPVLDDTEEIPGDLAARNGGADPSSD